MRQVTRTMIAADDGVLAGCRVLICDRDQRWSASIRERYTSLEYESYEPPLCQELGSLAARAVRHRQSPPNWCRLSISVTSRHRHGELVRGDLHRRLE